MEMTTKIKGLRILLYLGAAYYSIGGLAHFFSFTLFPFNDAALYQPYHDIVIALAALVVAVLLVSIARAPEKNHDALTAVIIGAIIAIVFSIWVILTIDFFALGAPHKRTQTIVEMVLLILYIVSLILLRPGRKITE